MIPGHVQAWQFWLSMCIPVLLMLWGAAEMALDSLDNGRHRKPS